VTTRSEVAAALTAAVPAARVIPYAKSIDNIARDQPVLMVYRESVAPHQILGCHTETLTVWAAVPTTDPAGEDLLDALLDDVLAVLDGKPLPSLGWDVAERDALGDAWPAYKITTNVVTRRNTP
jgi:hypothetical protein